MASITYYQTDDSGIFLYQDQAFQIPGAGNFNVPFMAVIKEPPAIPEGHRARWLSSLRPMDPEYDTAGEWVIEEIPPPEPAEEPTAESLAQT